MLMICLPWATRCSTSMQYVACVLTFKIGEESKDDVMFCGQRVRWHGNVIVVDQSKAIDALGEIPIAKGRKDEESCEPRSIRNTAVFWAA